jgi:hypothetical protein
MFSIHLDPSQADPPPTAADTWARQEAKSKTMAADLRRQARRATGQARGRERGRAIRLARFATYLGFGAMAGLALYWFR